MKSSTITLRVSGDVAKWLSMQSNSSEAIRLLIDKEIRDNGYRNITVDVDLFKIDKITLLRYFYSIKAPTTSAYIRNLMTINHSEYAEYINSDGFIKKININIYSLVSSGYLRKVARGIFEITSEGIKHIENIR